ncbi:hypothetical protein A2867_03050 [Candidatus Daviesbacteria bacterium RIFCSPHIGHO2_01_FULL_40_11]|uniref:Uncharacterized protein n=1 Tax=Candidatus Daviesbacteria bacterium RIFCSPHIGHO2_01_FULL_40_11 TaxID=1797762 RepID=A0A1F5JIV2_9BACT|nr:MAG: hypothetical protein A2867_03050 [Candidatus Daviesbacteria bacterium RIFCSPHIGHO2_01_FULL_40_11]
MLGFSSAVMPELEPSPFVRYLGDPRKLSEAVITASQKSDRFVITAGPFGQPQKILLYPNCDPKEIWLDILDPGKGDFPRQLSTVIRVLEDLPQVDYYTFGGVFLPPDSASSKLVDRIIKTASVPRLVRQKIERVVPPLAHISVFMACSGWENLLQALRIYQNARKEAG